MSRRSGTTLVEVLVAIFVMGIGLIALLTLFPIGILRMGYALNQQRAQDAARNADAVAIAQNLRNDGSMTNPGVVADATNADYFAQPLATLPAADPFGPSYPIFVDPVGYYNVPPGATQSWVGGVPGVLCRRPVSFVANITSATPALKTAAIQSLFANFTLWDDMVFEQAIAQATLPGTPKQVVPPTITRDTRFSWGYTMRRPMTSEKGVVDCSIVVFDGRSLSTSGAGLLSENVYQNTAYFNPTNGTITIDYTALPFGPPIRSGDWIMDVTYVASGNFGSCHAFWYRVVATEDLVVGATKLARYEVGQPIRGFEALPGTPVANFNPLPNTMPFNAVDPTTGLPQLATYRGSVVFLDAVVEVFEKGPARLP